MRSEKDIFDLFLSCANNDDRRDTFMYIKLITFFIVLFIFISACSKTEPNYETEAKTVTKTEAEAEAVTEKSNEQNNLAEKAFELFVEISAIPRGSGKEQQISDFLYNFGQSLDLEVIQDEALNVLIRKSGTKGRENEPTVILQTHMDMVWDKNESADFDFITDPIIPVIDNDWVTAQNETTLGADNGAGMAMVMAILSATDISHPPIEALFTSDEEDGMTGATSFDVSLLKGNRFINLDYETDGSFAVSSASFVSIYVMLPVTTAQVPQDIVTYKLMVKGLQGGHSGVDIHKGLANANILMALILTELNNIDFYISEINGGSRQNAIPRECSVVISFSNKDYDLVKLTIDQLERQFKADYPLDIDLEVTLEDTDKSQNVFSDETLSQILYMIKTAPNGVITYNPDVPEFVQTSSNLGIIVTENDKVSFTFAPRGSVMKELDEVLATFKNLADSINAEIIIGEPSAAWAFNPVSPLRDIMIEVFTEMYGKEPVVEAVHAGLECGIFASVMPGADIISIGPDIEGAHSPDERMSLSSFNRVLEFLVQFLAK